MCRKCNTSSRLCCSASRKNTHDEMIEVIKAIGEGRVIEARPLDSATWHTLGVKTPNFGLCQYRVKRELRILYCRETIKGTLFVHMENEESAADAVRLNGGRVVKFIEVLD